MEEQRLARTKMLHTRHDMEMEEQRQVKFGFSVLQVLEFVRTHFSAFLDEGQINTVVIRSLSTKNDFDVPRI